MYVGQIPYVHTVGEETMIGCVGVWGDPSVGRNTQAQQLAGTVYPILDVIYYGDRDDAMGNSPIDRLIITEHVARRIAAGLGTYSAQRLMCVRGQP